MALLAGLLWAAIAWGQPFDFEEVVLPFPSASGAMCTSLTNADEMAGLFNDAFSRTEGWRLQDDQFTLLPLLEPQGLNRDRHIVGTYLRFALHGFLFTTLEFRDISYPESTATEALGLNDADVVVGDYKDRGGFWHAFMFQDGRYTNLDPPFWDSKSWGCAAEAINTGGAIVGNCGNFAYLQYQGQFWPFMVPGSLVTFAYAINDSWGVAGTSCTAEACRGFVVFNGQFVDILVPGSTDTDVKALNDRGQICGVYNDAQGQHAFVGQPASQASR